MHLQPFFLPELMHKYAVRRCQDLETVQLLFFALPEVEGRGSGSPFGLDACAPVSAAYRWVTPGVCFSARKPSEEAMWDHT